MHSPQAIDLNTLQLGTGLCSFSQAHSLLKERARFFGRRPTTAPTAERFSSVPREKSLTAFAERAFSCTSRLQKDFSEHIPAFSCTRRLQNVLRLAFDRCCRAPAAFRTYSAWFSAKCCRRGLCHPLKHFSNGNKLVHLATSA